MKPICQYQLPLLAVFSEPILSSADAVQHILDIVVAQCLPSVVLEDSVLYVNHALVRLVSILLMSLPLSDSLADLQELDLLAAKIAELPNLQLYQRASLLLANVLTRFRLAAASH